MFELENDEGKWDWLQCEDGKGDNKFVITKNAFRFMKMNAFMLLLIAILLGARIIVQNELLICKSMKVLKFTNLLLSLEGNPETCNVYCNQDPPIPLSIPFHSQATSCLLNCLWTGGTRREIGTIIDGLLNV